MPCFEGKPLRSSGAPAPGRQAGAILSSRLRRLATALARCARSVGPVSELFVVGQFRLGWFETRQSEAQRLFYGQRSALLVATKLNGSSK